ncbi:MAG TPA: C45 family peptidase [Planctomycetaceae bacterium]|nr:C45 family peptidase [Planctomycetaceae bacterium]
MNPGLPCRLASLILLALSCGVLAAAEPFRFPERTYKQAELKYVHGLPVMILQGTPEQIGEQQAALVADVVRPLMAYPKKVLDEHGYGAAWPLAVGMSRRLIDNGPERFRRELEAAVSKSGLDGDALYVGNAMLELRRLGGCSSIIVLPERSATGQLLFGRNMDFDPMGILHQYSLVAVYRPEGRRAFVAVGFPGMIGAASGMNDAGLALATNDVYSSSDGSSMFNPEGAPLGFTFRRILEECATVAEAETLLRESKRTTWMNLAVCDPQSAAVFEITPDSVAVRKPDEGLLPCTNHFCVPGLTTEKQCWRFDRLVKAQDFDKLGHKEIAGLLDTVNQGKFTLQTMIFEPAARRLHLSIGEGPSSSRPLAPLELRPLLEAKRTAESGS